MDRTLSLGSTGSGDNSHDMIMQNGDDLDDNDKKAFDELID